MSSAPWLDGLADCFPRSYLLACPETQRYQRLPGYDCEISDFFSHPGDGKDMWFWHTFAQRVRGTKRMQRYGQSAKIDALSALEELPNELVDVIMDALIEDDDKIAVLALGLSSPVLYAKILARIHRKYASRSAATWAGKKIGFLGGDSLVDPSKVTASDDDFFEYMNLSYEPWWQRDGMEKVCIQPEKVWRESLLAAWDKWEGLKEGMWRAVDGDLSQDYMYPRDQVWVLKNLTTRQYVREDDLVPMKAILEDELLPDGVRKKMLHGEVRNGLFPNRRSELYDPTKPGKKLSRNKALEAFTLPQVFLVLTAHSGHPGWREEDVDFQWGPWVNHVFELVTLDEHLETRESDWKDVTADVAADVGHLRWCVMQHAMLEQAGGDDMWKKQRDFRQQARGARSKWTKWAQQGGTGDQVGTESALGDAVVT